MLTGVPLTLQESVYKYKLKIKDGDKVIEEDIEIDTEKQTQTYHIPKKYSGNGGEVDSYPCHEWKGNYRSLVLVTKLPEL